MFKFLKPNGRGCKTHSRLKGAVSIEYVVLLVCIALAALVAFGLTGKSIGGIVNNTKDMLVEKVDNATTLSVEESAGSEGSSDSKFDSSAWYVSNWGGHEAYSGAELNNNEWISAENYSEYTGAIYSYSPYSFHSIESQLDKISYDATTVGGSAWDGIKFVEVGTMPVGTMDQVGPNPTLDMIAVASVETLDGVMVRPAQ